MHRFTSRLPSARRPEILASDDARVHQASIHVGLYVAFATAVVLLLGCGLLITYVVRSQHRQCVVTNPISGRWGIPVSTAMDPCRVGLGHYEYLIDRARPSPP